MLLTDDAVEAQVEGWRRLAILHSRIAARLERSLEETFALSVSEYGVLDLLSRQEDYHLRMGQLGATMAMSQAATTRLVTRLEDRGLLVRCLCPDDRRGIYSEVTPDGRALLEKARPVHDDTLAAALREASTAPGMTHLIEAIGTTPSPDLPPGRHDRGVPSTRSVT